MCWKPGGLDITAISNKLENDDIKESESVLLNDRAASEVDFILMLMP